MSDSIDLLEAVGRDAALRRLSPEVLACRLKEAGATDVLASAARQRNSALLCEEFGVRVMGQPNSVNSPFHEEQPSPLKVPSPGNPEEDGDADGERNAQAAGAAVH
jgi:hypothetical protein